MQNRKSLPGDNEVDTFVGYDFGDRLTFTVGSSYIVGTCVVDAGSLIGLARGLYLGFPKNFNIPKKLILNNFFNALGKESSRYGNNFAAAGLLYHLVASSLNKGFEDEMSEMSNLQKNMFAGAITGGIFKSLRGPVGFAVGSTLGTVLMFTLTKLTEYGNQQGYVSFEIKY